MLAYRIAQGYYTALYTRALRLARGGASVGSWQTNRVKQGGIPHQPNEAALKHKAKHESLLSIKRNEGMSGQRNDASVKSPPEECGGLEKKAQSRRESPLCANKTTKEVEF